MIEVMTSDLPHTLYHPKDVEDEKQKDIDEATRLTIEAAKRRKAEQGYSISDVFEGKADEIAEQEENNE